MGTNELHGSPSTAKRRKACGGRFRETCLGRCPSRTTGRNPAPTCPSRDYCVPVRSNRRDDRPLAINHDQHMDSSNFFCALLPKTNLGSTITSSYPALHLIDRFRRVYGRCYFLCRNTPARDTRAKQ